MNEGFYTRDSGSSKRRVEPDNTTKKKTYAGKLKNETSQAEAMRKKLRTGKADHSLSKEELAKKARLRKQGRKAIAENVIVAGRVSGRTVSEASENSGDNNVSEETVLAGGQTLKETGRALERGGKKIYSSKAKSGKSGKAEGYGGKLHGKQAAKEAGATSHELQKSLMKKEIQSQAYKDSAKTAANSVGSFAKKYVDKAEDLVGRLAENIGEKVAEFVAEHPLGTLIAAAVLIVVLAVSASFSSCSMMAGGSGNMVIATSFTAQDPDILTVETNYKVKEADLQTEIDNIERDNPGYDEYRYSLSEIAHNPFELAALLTVLYEDYTPSEVQTKLQEIKDYQYKLTKERIVETRTRTETRWHWVTYYDEEGEPYEEYESYEVEVEYEYYILKVTLENQGIQKAVDSLGLTEEQKQRYEILLETKGNKPDIFGDNIYATPRISTEYNDYDVPAEYLTDQQFANMLKEAEKYLGYEYVWGGSSPSTSFDCSGFVSYVINNCGNGWNYGRLTANGLKNATARVAANDVKPGDLIFFQGTYDAVGASHVGIVVDPVNKVMIHCGNPIQYASYDTNYWRQHMYTYGRLQ